MTLQKPRIQRHAAMTFLGIDRHYMTTDTAAIPNQWHDFGPRIGQIPGQQGNAAYGVCHTLDSDSFGYLSAVEVLPPVDPGMEYRLIHFPERDYAVFVHEGDVTTLKDTLQAIWSEWLPRAERDVDRSIGFFERYGEAYDPATGRGDIEVWIPLAPQ